MRCSGEALVRAWRAGAGPGDGRLVIDVDSFVGEVCGRLKQGAAYGYTKVTRSEVWSSNGKATLRMINSGSGSAGSYGSADSACS